jgi:putative ABC transport system permease protein
VTAIRDSVKGIDQAVPLHLPRPLGEQMGFLMSGRRLISSVLGFLAVLGLLLAGVGLYGLVSETVIDRTREFAVRMAIGASAPDIVRAVLRRSLWLAAFGIAAGIPMAVALSAAIRSQLFGVTVLEPLAYLSAAAVLAAIVVAASLAPAIRATRLNTVDVLRTD